MTKTTVSESRTNPGFETLMSQILRTNSEPRYHDLDALRAFAMLLGIGLHASLSFTGFPWIVQDSHSSFVFAMMVAAIHGFRMQLFMLISGFFTMMLFRKRGLAAVTRQRFRRVFLPCMLGLVTIVPALDFVSYLAISNASGNPQALAAVSGSAIYDAVRAGDAPALKKALENGADPNQLDSRYGIPMLAWAALKGDVETARILIDAGAEIDRRSRNGSSPAHHASFMGHAGVLDLLIQRGADLKARSAEGHTAADTARTDDQTTRYFASVLGVKIESREALEKGREDCLKILEKHIETTPSSVGLKRPGLLARARNAYAGWIASDRFLTPWKRLGRPVHLFETDIFHHLWFLWHLCWIVALFAISSLLTAGFKSTSAIARRISPMGGLVIMLLLTFLPQLLMGTSGAGGLGPDTSTGVLPMPHLLFYYGVFFACGAFMFDHSEAAFGRIDGNSWWLRIGLCLALPATFMAYGTIVASGIAQTIYAWTMIFGLIRLFRGRFAGENRTIRYLADSSYWLYLAHLPLVVAAQAWISPWNLPSGAKFIGLTVCATAVLLVSYELIVRNTWIGRFLNGPRQHAPLSAEAPKLEPMLPPT